MNAPDKSPWVDDLRFTYKNQGRKVAAEGYGPLNAKILRNYAPTGKAGFYAQRNGRETFRFNI